MQQDGTGEGIPVGVGASWDGDSRAITACGKPRRARCDVLRCISKPKEATDTNPIGMGLQRRTRERPPGRKAVLVLRKASTLDSSKAKALLWITRPSGHAGQMICTME
eukprot:7813489-Prorocentrum_lima.AAC.1